eukprot:1540452-Pyramimonas_sp.AAC.1
MHRGQLRPCRPPCRRPPPRLLSRDLWAGACEWATTGAAIQSWTSNPFHNGGGEMETLFFRCW